MPLRLFQIVKDRLARRGREGLEKCERGTVSATFWSVNSRNLLFEEIPERHQLKLLTLKKTLSNFSWSGDDRARTDNLRLARAALSQLSYVPGKEI